MLEDNVIKGWKRQLLCFPLIREGRLTRHPWLPRYSFNESVIISGTLPSFQGLYIPLCTASLFPPALLHVFLLSFWKAFTSPQKVLASSCLFCLGPLSDYYAIKPLLLSSERAAGSLSNLKKSWFPPPPPFPEITRRRVPEFLIGMPVPGDGPLPFS